MIPKKVTVLVDTREKKPLLFPSHLKILPLVEALKRRSTPQIVTVNVCPHRMVIGDYAVKQYEHLVTVERKGSIGELMHNASGGDRARFLKAIERLKVIKHPILFLDCLPTSVFNPPPSLADRDPMMAVDVILGLAAHLNLHLIWGGRTTTSPRVRRRLGEIILRSMLHAIDKLTG